MEKKHPTIKRDETIRSVLIGVFVLATASVILLSERPLIMGVRSWVVPGAPLTHGTGPADFADTVDDFGVHVPKVRHRPLFAVATPAPTAEQVSAEYQQRSALGFGYSIREFDLLGMPFVPYREYGRVIYYESPREFAAVSATDDYLKQINVPAAASDNLWAFPFWRHMWGWLFALGLVGIGLFELGAARRRREALGLL